MTQIIQAIRAEILGYKTVETWLSQSGTDAPTLNSTKNYAGIALNPVYVAPGRFEIETTGGFDHEKTMLFGCSLGNSALVNDGDGIVKYFIESGKIIINTRDSFGALANDQLAFAPLEIRIYP